MVELHDNHRQPIWRRYSLSVYLKVARAQAQAGTQGFKGFVELIGSSLAMSLPPPHSPPLSLPHCPVHTSYCNIYIVCTKLSVRLAAYRYYILYT